MLLKRGAQPSPRHLAQVATETNFNETIRETLGSRVLSIIETAFAGPDTLREFNFSNASTDRILSLHVDDFSLLANWFGAIPPVANVQQYSGQEAFNKYVNGIVTSISIPNVQDELVLFGKWSPNLLLEKSGFLGQFKLGPNNYEPLERNNIIRLSDNVDFFIFGKYVYIKDDNAFESMVAFREMTREMANEAFEDVRQVLPVRNGEQVFENLRGSARRLKRVAKTLGADHVQLLTIPAVQVLIEQQKLPIYVENGELVVDPDDREQIDALIYIINDSYARSVLTELWYRIHDADPIS